MNFSALRVLRFPLPTPCARRWKMPVSSESAGRFVFLLLALCAGFAVLSAAPMAGAQATSRSGTAATDEEGRLLFEAGSRAFADARYDVALARFREAYELSRRPALLYNVGQAADRLRLDTDALAAFEGYLAALPNAPNRREVEVRVAALRRVLGERASAPATPALSAPATPAPSAPATPALSAPATPAPSAPATPAPSAPATPAPSAPATPALSAPATPAPSVAATPALETNPASPPPSAVSAPSPSTGEVATESVSAGHPDVESSAPPATTNDAPGETVRPAWAGWLALGGVALAASGIVPALMASGTTSELDALCDEDRICSADAQPLLDRGASQALAADVLFAAGGAMAIGFGLVWLLGGEPGEATPNLGAWCDGEGCRVSAGGRF
jgi:hypothetical protein